jgi:hypothetical protein
MKKINLNLKGRIIKLLKDNMTKKKSKVLKHKKAAKVNNISKAKKEVSLASNRKISNTIRAQQIPKLQIQAEQIMISLLRINIKHSLRFSISYS